MSPWIGWAAAAQDAEKEAITATLGLLLVRVLLPDLWKRLGFRSRKGKGKDD